MQFISNSAAIRRDLYKKGCKENDWCQSDFDIYMEHCLSIRVFYLSAYAQIIGKRYGFFPMEQFYKTSRIPRMECGLCGLIHPIDVVYESCLYPYQCEVDDYLALFQILSPFFENWFFQFFGTNDYCFDKTAWKQLKEVVEIEKVRNDLIELRELYMKWIKFPETDIPPYYTYVRLVLPKKRRIVQKHEFAHREELSFVEMPDSISLIRRSAFWGCHHLKRVMFSKRLKTIEKSAFGNCYMLKEIVFPEGMESIGDAAFFKCSQLENIVIPKSVRHIGRHAFGMCRGLKHVRLPKDIVTEDAFYESPQCVIEYY